MSGRAGATGHRPARRASEGIRRGPSPARRAGMWPSSSPGQYGGAEPMDCIQLVRRSPYQPDAPARVRGHPPSLARRADKGASYAERGDAGDDPAWRHTSPTRQRGSAPHPGATTWGNPLWRVGLVDYRGTIRGTRRCGRRPGMEAYQPDAPARVCPPSWCNDLGQPSLARWAGRLQGHHTRNAAMRETTRHGGIPARRASEGLLPILVQRPGATLAGASGLVDYRGIIRGTRRCRR